jgi:hybrid cluster-associated redox disulfide protein
LKETLRGGLEVCPSLFAPAQRQDRVKRVSLGQMDTPLHTQLTVDNVLQDWPQSFSVFMKNKTKCPGCFMQQFCTLNDVAETYGISVERLIEEIVNVSEKKNI